jgi:hypothetical protein
VAAGFAFCKSGVMSKPLATEDKLTWLLAQLATGQFAVYAAASSSAVAEASARFHGMKRADEPGRDQSVYRAGAAFELAGLLSLDDYWLTGALIAQEVPSWLAEITAQHRAVNEPLTLAAALTMLFEDETRRKYLIHLGAWRRHFWSQTAYRLAVEEFEASAKAEGGSWRARKPTEKQRYAILQIARTASAMDPEFRCPDFETRGAAHDWIKQNLGNPRFVDDLTPPTLEEFE